MEMAISHYFLNMVSITEAVHWDLAWALSAMTLTHI